MKISVIIPVYNEQKTIKKILEAVYGSAKQNRLDLEVIVY